MPATARTGSASTISTDVIKVIHVNTGNLNMVMPGARRLIIVTMKLSPAAIDATPRTPRLITQNVMPFDGLYSVWELGAYPNQPPFGASPTSQLVLSSRLPNRKSQ